MPVRPTNWTPAFAVLVLAGWGLGAPAAVAQGWSARKRPATHATPEKKKGHKPAVRSKSTRGKGSGSGGPGASGSAKKPATDSPAPGTSAAASLSLSTQVDALVARGPRLSAREALPVLRLAVARREMIDAVRLAEAVASARGVGPAELLEAANVLGRGQRIPVQRRLLERAYTSRRVPEYLQAPVAEAWFDALMAAGETDAARKVLARAIARTQVGRRQGLFERLVAWGRVQGAIEATWEELLGTLDPDAAILAAQLGEEIEGPAAGLDVLRRGWKRFPAHRRLQTLYIKALGRQGHREELARVVARVVALSPTDPMPWLEVVDAHIMARDRKAARQLIDRLASQHPHSDVLIESLIDRQQRLPGDRAQIERLFEALLRAAPDQAQHIEAYGEWLLSTGNAAERRKGTAVLKRLLDLPAGRYDGMRRMAAILQAHGMTREAEQLLLTMLKEFPTEPETTRLLAILYGQTGRDSGAEQRWLSLSALADKPDSAARQRAAEARRSLVALYRKTERLAPRRDQLSGRLLKAPATLGETLMLFDLLDGAAETLGDDSLPAGWLEGTHPALQRWAQDTEVRSLRANLLMRHGRLAHALELLLALEKDEPDAARAPLLRVVEAALAAGQAELATRAEAPLLSERHANTALLLQLGEARLRHGDVTTASARFRRAAARSPGDTRATYRLAQLLRQSGATGDEAAVLRDIVLRTVDGDELDAAGQRLLTLAIGDGACGELLRWLDAITPQHPRREVVQRFRLLAYDAWLRSELLERALGETGGREPGPAMVYEALDSGDLAVRVRALRQVARRRTRVPPALARRLMKDPSAVVRRDTAMALGASGTPEATGLLVEMDAESTREVQIAQLLAFGRLPPAPPVEPVLVSHLRRNDRTTSGLAALALGRVAGSGGLAALNERMRHRRASRSRPSVYLALGALVGRLPDDEAAPMAVDLLADGAREIHLDRRTGSRERLDVYAALWGLAAAGTPRARAVLLDRAVSMDSTSLRLFTLRLLAGPPPTLDPELWQRDVQWPKVEGIDERLVRRHLLPWLRGETGALSKAIAAHASALLPGLRAHLGGDLQRQRRARWCADIEGARQASPDLAEFCADRRPEPPASTP